MPDPSAYPNPKDKFNARILDLVKRVGILERKHSVPWATSSLLSGWTNYGSDHPPARHRVRNGNLELVGMLNTGTITTGTVIFYTGVALSHRPILDITCNDLHSTIEIGVTGDVKCRNIVAAGWIAYVLSIPIKMT